MDRKVVILPNDGSKVFERVLGVTPSGELERGWIFRVYEGKNIQDVKRMLVII